jgi:hypothetical protein
MRVRLDRAPTFEIVGRFGIGVADINKIERGETVGKEGNSDT